MGTGFPEKGVRGFLAGILVLALAGSTAWLFQSAEEARRTLRLEKTRRKRAEAQVARLEAGIGALRKEVEGLWEQLARAREQKEGRDRILDEIERKLASRRERPPTPQWRKRLEQARAMIPLTAALNRALRLSGASRLRFFSIGGREGKALLDVNLHHLDSTGLIDRVVRAEKLYLTLDPARRELRITCPRGKILQEGKWVPFGPEGWELLVPMVDPEPWKGLAFPVVEILPEPPPGPASRPAFPYWERKLWLDRFQALLSGEPSLEKHLFRLLSLGGLTPRGFREVELLGYTPKGLLVERFRAEELRVERAAGKGIRFVLFRGIHEDSLGSRPLPPGGFLLYFPGARPSEWARALGDRFLSGPRKGL